MMEFLVIPLAIGAFVFVIFMLALVVGWFRSRSKGAAFQNYVAEHFPDLPAPSEMLCAAQQSKGKEDVALLVAAERKEIIVVLDKDDGMMHIAFPFSALTGVDSSNRIISRGVPTSRVYSYEQTMTVNFSDGSSVPLILEMPSNKHGTDKAPRLVADVFAPWLEQLNEVLAIRA